MTEATQKGFPEEFSEREKFLQGNRKKKPMKRFLISLSERDIAWIKENSIHLSRFIANAIEDQRRKELSENYLFWQDIKSRSPEVKKEIFEYLQTLFKDPEYIKAVEKLKNEKPDYNLRIKMREQDLMRHAAVYTQVSPKLKEKSKGKKKEVKEELEVVPELD